jgi:hypothetical protein
VKREELHSSTFSLLAASAQFKSNLPPLLRDKRNTRKSRRDINRTRALKEKKKKKKREGRKENRRGFTSFFFLKTHQR